MDILIFLSLFIIVLHVKAQENTNSYSAINCANASDLNARFPFRLHEFQLHFPCLSGIGHHVYVMETSFVVPDFCNHVKTVGIPFSYSPFLSDNTFGLGLTWNLENSQDSVPTKFTSSSVQQGAWQFKGLNEIADDKALGCIILLMFIVVMLLNIQKLSQYSKRVEKEKENQKEPHADSIFGNYEALNKIVIKN